jgi:hypothetical protein
LIAVNAMRDLHAALRQNAQARRRLKFPDRAGCDNEIDRERPEWEPFRGFRHFESGLAALYNVQMAAFLRRPDRVTGRLTSCA